ncbi:hypothetical protein C0993_000209 [Termitomyces sp. T159_Od127]|nr:hypothetical protein C0993_000209 [Termitomyces sp. T159_Od127]
MQQQKSYLEGGELMPFFCRALYNYEAHDRSALSFRCGDIVEVLTQEPSGLWDGLLRDERGWFPSNYVEVISDDDAVQALIAAGELVAETSIKQPLSISPMVNMSQTVDYQVNQGANEKWLKNDVLGSKKKSFSENTTRERSQTQDHWIPGVRSDGKDGRRSYKMPRDGDEYFSDSDSAGLVLQAIASSVTRTSLGHNASLKPTESKQDIAGPSIIRRPPTPESLEKELHEDGKSHIYYNRTMRTLSKGADDTSSQTITPPQRQKAVNSNIKRSSQYSNDLDRYSRQNPLRTSTMNQVLSKPSSTTYTRLTALANSLPEYTLAERIARSLQHIVAPSLPEGVTKLATTAESVIQAILDNIRMNGFARRPEEDDRLHDLIYDVVAVVRNLLYGLAVPTFQIPQNVLPREVRDSPLLPRSPLKPVQRKVTAALSRLILSARAIQYDSGSSMADILRRLESDAEGLRKDVFAFIRRVQELKHSSKPMPRHKYPKRLRGAFDTQNVGPGLVGAGAAGRWKGFGWISLDEEQAASRRMLGLEVISQLRHALNNHNTEFQSFLHILQTPHQNSGLSAFQSPKAYFIETLPNVIVEQVRLSGQDLVSRVSSFVNTISDIHVARHVDVDGLLQDGTGPYGSTIESAQRLVRKLEAVTQAVNDDTSVFLLTLQSHLSQHYQQRDHAWNRLVTLASALTANMTVLLETLCALFSLGHEQAELSLGNYNESIAWRMSRLSLCHSTNNKDGSDGVEMTGDVPKFFAPYDRNSGTSETFESSKEYDSANNTPPSEDEGPYERECSNITSILSFSKHLPTEISYKRESLTQPNKQVGDEYVNKKPIDAKPWYLRSNHNDKEILIALDNTVKGGTLPALVEQLTTHDNVGSSPQLFFQTNLSSACHIDTSFNRAFLMTFRSFMTVNELIDLLFARFQIQPPPDLKPSELESWKRHKQKLVQLRHHRVINTILTILKDDSILKTEDLHVIKRLKAFISSDAISRVGAANQVSLFERMTRNDNKVPNVVMRSPPPPPLYPKTTKKLKLTDIKPLELARQLTLMESNLYRKIRSMECLQRAREQKAEHTDNITKIIQMSNRIADWVTECILSLDDARKRATIVKYFISVADYCWTLNNFSSMFAITSGLTTQPIHRLKRTWELVGQQSMEQFATCESTIECTKSVFKYRQLMDLVNPPCVPFIGVYLSVLRFNHDGNSDMLPGGLVNFRKRQKAFEVITDLTRWQAQPFNLQPIPAIQTWIQESLSRFNDTKAWSDQFWVLSMELEPREREDEKMARLLLESGFL